MSSTAPVTNPLPPIRRIVTGHDAQGRSRHILDASFPTEIIQKNERVVGFKVLWTSPNVPCQDNGVFDFSDAAYCTTLDLANDRGAVVRVVDFAPGGKAMMHRTSSLDYAVVISGEITHIVDQGDPLLMRAGDVLIQRGTMHAWSNRSHEWARMHFVLIAANPVTIDGKSLGAWGYKSSDVASGRLPAMDQNGHCQANGHGKNRLKRD